MISSLKTFLLCLVLSSFGADAFVLVPLKGQCHPKNALATRSYGLNSPRKQTSQCNLMSSSRSQPAVVNGKPDAPSEEANGPKKLASKASSRRKRIFTEDSEDESYLGVYNGMPDECSIDAAQLDEDVSLLVEEMGEAVDLSRENARMDSLNSYIVVSVLTATASFSTVETLDLTQAGFDLALIHYGAIVMSVLSSLTGIYATVVFSLCSAVSWIRINAGMCFVE